jgi:hypothetical protein
MSVDTPKYCQSCIERGYRPPNIATREWEKGIYICDDCFRPLIDNLSNISPEVAREVISSPGVDVSQPILREIYRILEIPEELQFDTLDKTCRHRDRIFNLHAIATVNIKDIEELAKEIETRSIALFQIQYSLEALKSQIDKLKQARREEKNLKSYEDSKEVYSTVKKRSSKVKDTQEEKMAKILGMSLDEYKAFQETSREKEKLKKIREFNVMAGNCPDCGGSMPCSNHSQANS